jgi:hypothetical protein
MHRRDSTYTKSVYAHRNLETNPDGTGGVRTTAPIKAGTILSIEHVFCGGLNTAIVGVLKNNREVLAALDDDDSSSISEKVVRAGYRGCFACDAVDAALTVSTSAYQTSETPTAIVGFETLSFDNAEIEHATFVVVFASVDMQRHAPVVVSHSNPGSAAPFLRRSRDKITSLVSTYTKTNAFVDRHVFHILARKGMYVDHMNVPRFGETFGRFLESRGKTTLADDVVPFVEEYTSHLATLTRDEVDPLWVARRVLAAAPNAEVVLLGR